MFNILDIIIVLFILMFGIIGSKRGIIKEVVSLVGIVLIFIISAIFSNSLGNFLCKYMPFFKFTGNIKGLVVLNVLIYKVIAFFIVFFILLGIYHLVMFFTKFLQKIVDSTIILSIPSSICGFIIGMVRGFIIILLILIALMVPFKDDDVYNGSKLKNFILYKTPLVSINISSYANGISDAFELGEKIATKKISTNEANLQLATNMLKLKVVDKHTMEQLIVLDKFKSVKGIEKIIGNY